MIIVVMIIKTEFVLRCKQGRYEWSSWLWLLRLNLYRGVSNVVMNDVVIKNIIVYIAVKTQSQ